MYKSFAWFCQTSVCLKTCFAFSCGYQWKLALTIKILQFGLEDMLFEDLHQFFFCVIQAKYVFVFLFIIEGCVCWVDIIIPEQTKWGIDRACSMVICKMVAKMYGCSDQSLCIPGTLGLKEMCVLYFFHFCAKYAHMCIDENLA